MRGDFDDAITNDSVDLLLGEINIWRSVNDTAEGRGIATLSEKRALLERSRYLIKTKV